MSKYIIELNEDCKIVQQMCVTEHGNAYTDGCYSCDLEKLNSDYINEHYGELQDEAYKKGFEDGKKSQNDDRIEVGDEVNWLGDCFIVTRIFQPHNMKGQCDGIDDDGCVYHDVLMDDLTKTGRHFDIASILEAMRA